MSDDQIGGNGGEQSVVLHSSDGKKLDCQCEALIEWDAKTIGVHFPSLQFDRDRERGPSFYCTINGDELTLRIGDTEDMYWSFVWCESRSKWFPRDRPDKYQHQEDVV